MHPYRTRFKKEIVAEFFPPIRRIRQAHRKQAQSKPLTRKKPKEDRVIIYCPGQPGSPGNRGLLEFWAKRGYWVLQFRYRGSWESGGRFLECSPERDALDIVDELPKGFTEYFAHKKFRISANAEIYLFGSSFGGPAALLASRDPRITKVVCSSPVVDWKDHIRHGETIDRGARFTREAFGMAYRTSPLGWKKLKTGKFYNPSAHIDELDGAKILIIHAKDDDVVRFGPVARFAKRTGAKLMTFARGGHGSSSWFTKPRIYRKISAFLKQK